jgi:hypothetical protein
VPEAGWWGARAAVNIRVKTIRKGVFGWRTSSISW